MTEEQLNFREWTGHYEKEQETQRDQIGDLTKIVSSLTADVRTLIDNQRGMFGRINKPPQWGAMISLGALIVVGAGLLTAPIKDDIVHIEAQMLRNDERNLELHMWMKDQLDDLEVQSAKAETNVEWLSRLEERADIRLHP